MAPVETRLEGDIAELRDEFSELRDEIATLRQKDVEHEVRFGNGREVMADMKKDIADLKPKAPDWLKVLGVGVGLVATTLGAHYWLIEQFNDRPTGVQIEKAFREHGESGHADSHRDINEIRTHQAEQGTILNGLMGTVSKQGEKLDQILNRLPSKR
jgi:hypothetical protein